MSHTARNASQNSAKMVTLLLAATLFAGCHSKTAPTSQADFESMQAKAATQAAATGSPQTFTSINSAGQTVATTVQPPLNGAPGAVTSVVTGPATDGSAPPANNGVAPVNNADGANSYSSGPATGNPASNRVSNSTGSAPGYGPGQTTGNAPAADNSYAPANGPMSIDVPAGTNLSIRVNQHISVKTTHPGDSFSGTMAAPVAEGNAVVIPQGSDVEGVVASAHKRGHFKGASILQLRLTSITIHGRRYPLNTRDLTRTKKGKGKRSLAFIGGGTGLGMLIGGVAAGGPGLLIGGLAGAGAGTGVAGLTGNRDIEIPAESIVSFRLADDLVIRE